MDITRNKRDCILKIRDGATTPGEKLLKLAEGDFTYNPPEKSEKIFVKNKKGYLDHTKEGDPFNGAGKVSWTDKFKDFSILEAVTNPATTSAVAADLIPAASPTVNLHHGIYDDDGVTLVKVVNIYNVHFDPGKQIYSEGDNYNTIKFAGEILGKYDAEAPGERIFVDYSDAFPA